MARDYEQLAVDVTRELSRTWTLADIEEHYAAEAREELAPVLHAGMDSLKPLGVLLYADNVRVETRWSRAFWHDVDSPAVAAERLADLIGRSVKVTFVGKFAGGFADVTARAQARRWPHEALAPADRQPRKARTRRLSRAPGHKPRLKPRSSAI